VQVPPEHAEDTHATGVPQVPLAVQVWTPLPEHCFAEGEQTPVQTPPTQACVEQAAPSCQDPVALQV
jgi:hypothetical protein